MNILVFIQSITIPPIHHHCSEMYSRSDQPAWDHNLYSDEVSPLISKLLESA